MAEFDFDKFTKDLMQGISSAANSVSAAASGAAADVSRFREINQVGRDLFLNQLTVGQGSAVSVCDGQTIWITREAARLGHLSPNDIQSITLTPAVDEAPAADELLWHRAIYQALAERLAANGEVLATAAVIHSQGLHTTYHSLLTNSILPADAVGQAYLGSAVPVLAPNEPLVAGDLAQTLAQLVRHGGQLAVVRGRGAFVLADSLNNAQNLTDILERTAQLAVLLSADHSKVGR
ncbi:MAG: class II aldolase/adducin family protein [Actinomycetia bacterium]|nr:class II aldolase/adducin family protein [Actinomycetes bacterium]